MIIEPTLSDDHLDRRREHLMREITLVRAGREAVQPPARPNRQHRRIPWRGSLVGGLATAGLAAAILVTMVVTSSGHPGLARPAFAFQRMSNETVSVKIVNTTVDADEMSRQLRQQGLNARIDAMPASPQLVGAWMTVSFSGDFPTAAHDAIQSQFRNGYASTIELPASFTGWIRFGVGVAPVPGQELQVVGIRNALAPNARLGCLHATDGDPQIVQRAVQSLGYTIIWADGDPLNLVSVQGPTAGQRVVAAFIQDATPTQVQLVLSTPGARRYLPRSQQGYGQLWDTRATNPSSCTHV